MSSEQNGKGSLPHPKAVVFDWDNTLVDTWPVIHASLKVTFEAMDQEPWTFAETKERVSKSLRDSFPEQFGDRWEEARDVFYTAFEQNHLTALEPLDRAQDLLQHLQTEGHTLALVSNKTGKYLRLEVEHLGWGAYFSAVVGAGDAVRDKPDPAALDLALKPKGLAVDRSVWFIGDSRSDMELARNTGCSSILVHPQYDREKTVFSDCPPDIHVPDLKELIAIFRDHG